MEEIPSAGATEPTGFGPESVFCFRGRSAVSIVQARGARQLLRRLQFADAAAARPRKTQERRAERRVYLMLLRLMAMRESSRYLLRGQRGYIMLGERSRI